MAKRFLLAIILASSTLMGFAQDESVLKKLSVTTQMFLEELQGNLSFNHENLSEKTLGLVPSEDLKLERLTTSRLYAAPEIVDGKAYIAAFIRLNNNSSISGLEALGVKVQTKFQSGLVTALIPIDKITEVAAIGHVRNINVSKLMRPTTKIARQMTNTDDILTFSSDAQTLGLQKKYDGTGVVLGIIDTGIDFQHIAFKDKDGNSRIKRAYVYDGSTAKEYTEVTSTAPTTDDNTGDHGTHTSSTAGGSSVIIDGNNVTVTDDHASATYGGMAPGADLYLAGIKDLSSTYLTNAVYNMTLYADEQGQPLVVSNSWGSQFGPHDGTGEEALVYNELFGDSHPNRVALFASSNDGGKCTDKVNNISVGGYHVSGQATDEASPFGTLLRAHTYSNTDGGYYYLGIVANVWARNPNVEQLAVKVYVLDTKTGEVKDSKTVTSKGILFPPSITFPLYYSGSLKVYFDQVDSEKTQILLYSEGMESRGASQDGYMENGTTAYYTSSYTLAMEVYPYTYKDDNGTKGTVVDAWGGNYGFFSGGNNFITTAGHTWTAGSDDMCVSDEATIANIISVGAYVSQEKTTDYNGTDHHHPEYTEGDIAYFSSYATAAESPTGLQYPWITAPGARLNAAVNHYHTASIDSYSYYGDTFNSDLVVNNPNYPYAAMEGTSMATPTAAGIVTLWMQAARERGKNLTVSDIKTIMDNTAIKDTWVTNGDNASHFGKGKIDALNGIKVILDATPDPTIVATPTTVVFSGYATRTYTETFNVKGFNLTEGVTATLTDGNGVFAISSISVTEDAVEGENGVDITITWSPAIANVGITSEATITLNSAGANPVIINVRGTALAPTPTIISDKESLVFFAEPNTTPSQSIIVTGRFLTSDVTATLGGDNASVFSVSPASASATNVNDNTSSTGATFTVTFSPTTAGTYTATLTLASTGAENVVINLSGEAATGGTANSAYLNIKNYASINTAGWDTGRVDNLYIYSEYQDEGNAWLTMPMFGAFIGVDAAPKAQNWMANDVTFDTSTSRTKKSWEAIANDNYLGSSRYFTTKDAYVMGNGTSNEQFSFTVTNVTAVKLYGETGRTDHVFGITSPTTLTVYECTEDVNAGTLTVSSTATATEIESRENTIVNLSIMGLDRTKIYKVVAEEKSGYLYEVGFRTPIDVTRPQVFANPSSITLPSVEIEQTSTQTFKVSGVNLTGNVTATLTNDGGGVFSIDKTTISKANAEGEGEDITVTFSPMTASHDYEGTITLSSEGLQQNVVVSLSASSTATESFYDATISTLGLSTMYLPFPVEIPYDTYEDLLGVFYITDTSNQAEYTLKRLNSTIPAYTGVIIQGNSGTYRFPKTTTAVELKYENKLSGTVEENYTVTQALLDAHASSTAIVMTLGRSSDNYINFYRYSGTKLNPYKAFLIYDGNSNVKELSLDFGGGTDGIHLMRNNVDQNAWYSLEGVKQNGKPSQKGVYIHHGKRIIIQ